MDMRQLDPAIGRWVVQDPVIHHDYSPYSAFDNNPVYWSDPSGADAIQIGDNFHFSGDDAIKFFEEYLNRLNQKESTEETVSNMYEFETERDEIDTSGGGGGNGYYTIKNGIKVVRDTGKAAELIDALDKSLGKNSKLFGKIGKIGGWMSMGGEVIFDGIELYEGKISGYRFSFRFGAVVTSAVVGAEVGTLIGGPYGFVAGTVIGLSAGGMERAWDVWWPQFQGGIGNFYNNIIYNISRYY